MKKLSLFRTLVVFLFVTLPIIFYAQNIEAQIDALMSNQYKTNLNLVHVFNTRQA